MAREAIKNDVPELWRTRYRAGLCPVCGKDKTEFAKHMRVFCCKKHREEYASKYTTWTELRAEVLKRDKKTCTECGTNQKKVDEEYKKERQGTFEEKFNKWLEKPENQKIFQIMKDKELVEASEQFERSMELINGSPIEFYQANKYSFPKETQLIQLQYKYPYVELEVDHITAIMNGGDMWDKNNLRTLCKECHTKKTKNDHREKRMLPNKKDQTKLGE